MSRCIGGRNSVQKNFIKKFEHILSKNPEEKIKNPLFQYTHGFNSPIPGGPIRSEVRSLKTIDFPNFRQTRKRRPKKKGGTNKKLNSITKKQPQNRRSSKIGGKKSKKGGKKSISVGSRKPKIGGKGQKKGGAKL